MKRSDAFPSKYLKASDLPAEGIEVTIKSVTREQVGDDVRPVAKLHGHTKSLSLNLTNWDLIVSLLRETDSDRWAGREIPIYPTTCPYKGEIVECIRVRERAQPDQRESGWVAAMLRSFAELNVTRAQIEARLGHSLAELNARDKEILNEIHQAMVEGASFPKTPPVNLWPVEAGPGELEVRRGW